MLNAEKRDIDLKNILFFRPSICKTDGALRVTIHLCNSLSKKFNVHLLNFFDNECIFTVNEKVIIKKLCYSKKKMRYGIWSLLLKFRKYINDNNIEIIISETRLYLFVVFLATIDLNVKIFYHNHFSINEFLKSKKVTKNYKDIILNVVNWYFEKKTERIIVLTNGERSNYIKQGVEDKRIITIYNWLESKLLENNIEYNIQSKKIITVGRIDYQKGYEYLVEIARKVFEIYPDWVWHIYGEGNKDYTLKIRKLIKDKGLEKNVILMGNKDNIYDEYNKYAFLVMTSRYEGLPMVLLEAKAKKLPLVSFDIESGPSEIIRNDIDGFLVPAFDTQAMSCKLCELIESPELRQKFSDNVHGNLEKFSKEKIMRQWCDLIEGIE